MMARSILSTSIMRQALRSNPVEKIAIRNFSKTKPTTFKEKTIYEAWCSDTGAYPVMGVIVFAVVFSTGAGLYFMLTHPDSRFSKASRKALFRGELKNESIN
mmetsp:Transcript_373/g.526  ORF Transcript_373/g.526 Transcript_373/m.526 type:complete len:102 (-) Transcript_373:74-379(-)